MKFLTLPRGVMPVLLERALRELSPRYNNEIPCKEARRLVGQFIREQYGEEYLDTRIRDRDGLMNWENAVDASRHRLKELGTIKPRSKTGIWSLVVPPEAKFESHTMQTNIIFDAPEKTVVASYELIEADMAIFCANNFPGGGRFELSGNPLKINFFNDGDAKKFRDFWITPIEEWIEREQNLRDTISKLEVENKALRSSARPSIVRTDPTVADLKKRLKLVGDEFYKLNCALHDIRDIIDQHIFDDDDEDAAILVPPPSKTQRHGRLRIDAKTPYVDGIIEQTIIDILGTWNRAATAAEILHEVDQRIEFLPEQYAVRGAVGGRKRSDKVWQNRVHLAKHKLVKKGIMGKGRNEWVLVKQTA